MAASAINDTVGTTMKLVYLLRHAKSGRDDPSLDDIDRPLDTRGRQAAALMGEFIARNGIRPGLILCSPALRTRQTLDRVKSSLNGAPVAIEPRIYEASARTLLNILRQTPPDHESVLMIGHNPGVERLAATLAGAPSPELALLREKYPTGAMAVLEAHIDSWTDLDDGCARLTGFIRPRDLE